MLLLVSQLTVTLTEELVPIMHPELELNMVLMHNSSNASA